MAIQCNKYHKRYSNSAVTQCLTRIKLLKTIQDIVKDLKSTHKKKIFSNALMRLHFIRTRP